MALGKRRQKQTSLWVEASRLQARERHPFYSRVNEILEGAKFDTYAERICRKYYAKAMGRPSIVPGVYFRCFLCLTTSSAQFLGEELLHRLFGAVLPNPQQDPALQLVTHRNI